ncbi:hypothetical protein GCM10027168_31220 [Streptomyces capparidis]
MESADSAVRRLEQIRQWTLRPLETEASLAEAECALVLASVTGRGCRAVPLDTGPVASTDAREHYARLARCLHRAHETYTANAQVRGPLGRARHRISADGGLSAARNHRGAYETSLLLARLAAARGEVNATYRWLDAAREALDRYCARLALGLHFVVSPHSTGALQPQADLYLQAKNCFDTDVARLWRVFGQICRHVAARAGPE